MKPGYHGQAEVDVGYFYCPYIPIFKVVRGERKIFFINTSQPPPVPPTELQLRIMELVRNPKGYASL